MSPILIFDLDDTLYPEQSFVQGGFRAVANWLESQYGWDAGTSLEMMNHILAEEGRGAVFNRLLAANGKASNVKIGRCLQVYRYHLPDIKLYPAAEKILMRLAQHFYVVTDGHKDVQYRKVKALGLETRCSKVFITHRYGIKHAKPSPFCFEKIKQNERCDWKHMIYVADNPAKDFVGLNPLGVRTVRVLTGEHRNVSALPGHEARQVIDNLGDLPMVLTDLDWIC
jgi:putative hydrolase of the HAD superfamily